MSGKQFFCVCCKQMGLDPSEFFKIGEQNTACSGGYVYHCPYKLRTPSQIYIVNYLKNRDIYVAWGLDHPDAQKKIVFRVLEKPLERLSQGEVLAISKSLGHRGWGEEIVYAFDREAAPEFIRRVKRDACEG